MDSPTPKFHLPHWLQAIVASAGGLGLFLIAFLDSDDIWHAKYLEVQQQVVLKYPNAVGFFTGHVDFAAFWRFRQAEAAAVLP